MAIPDNIKALGNDELADMLSGAERKHFMAQRRTADTAILYQQLKREWERRQLASSANPDNHVSLLAEEALDGYTGRSHGGH